MAEVREMLRETLFCVRVRARGGAIKREKERIIMRGRQKVPFRYIGF